MPGPAQSATEPVTRAPPPQIPITCPFTDDEMLQAWEKCAHTVQEHCDHMVQRWKEEIDMFLVFAGLFSAVLTAFNVQSYALLQQDNSDLTAQALIQISAQLSALSFSGTSINSTQPPFLRPAFAAPGYAVWINTLWFSALIFTLSASSIAIMVKQWLQQYSQGLSGNSHEIARLRQYRYESLLKWHVVGIIAMLPILLQVSLAMFLAGLVILLTTLNPVVAAMGTFFVGCLVIFTITTAILPAFQPDCFYQSPQAIGLFLVVQSVRRILKVNRRKLFRNWRAREIAEVREKRADLDRGLATKSYSITLDEGLLKTAVIPCMWNLPPGRLTPFLEDILRVSNRFEPLVPCILNFLTLAAREPKSNGKMVNKLLAEDWWPRMEANSEIGEHFVRTMAILVSRGFETNYAFYRVTQTLSYSAIDVGCRVKPELVEQLVSILPNPKTNRQNAALIRTRDPRGLPMVYSYFKIVPALVRYFARLVIDDPHDVERVQLQIDTMLDTLQTFLINFSWSSDPSNLATILWAMRSSAHLAEMVRLKTDAKCSPLIPPDVVESYQDILSTIRSEAHTKAFQTYFRKLLDKLPATELGSRDPFRIVALLQEDLDVLSKLSWMLPWQQSSTRRRGGSTSGSYSASSPPFTPRSNITPPNTGKMESPIRPPPSPRQANISQNSSASSVTKVSESSSRSRDPSATASPSKPSSTPRTKETSRPESPPDTMELVPLHNGNSQAITLLTPDTTPWQPRAEPVAPPRSDNAEFAISVEPPTTSPDAASPLQSRRARMRHKLDQAKRSAAPSVDDTAYRFPVPDTTLLALSGLEFGNSRDGGGDSAMEPSLSLTPAGPDPSSFVLDFEQAVYSRLHGPSQPSPQRAEAHSGSNSEMETEGSPFLVGSDRLRRRSPSVSRMV